MEFTAYFVLFLSTVFLHLKLTHLIKLPPKLRSKPSLVPGI